MCTWDTSTTRSPSLKGLVVFWWTCHVSAGQYFDRPNPHVVAKHIGSSHTDDGHTMATLSSFVSPSIRYIWQWLRVRVWFTISAIQEQLLGASGGRYSIQDLLPRTPSSSSSQVGRGVNKAYSYWSDFWSLYGLSLQAMLPVAIMAMYASHFFGELEIVSFFMNIIKWDPDEDTRESRPFGAYRKLEKPSMGHMLMLLSIGGTLASIILYGRVVLPFPDLVAGSNVLKAVRNETKSSGAPSTVRPPVVRWLFPENEWHHPFSPPSLCHVQSSHRNQPSPNLREKTLMFRGQSNTNRLLWKTSFVSFARLPWFVCWRGFSFARSCLGWDRRVAIPVTVKKAYRLRNSPEYCIPLESRPLYGPILFTSRNPPL
jgi:hypothetical protein